MRSWSWRLIGAPTVVREEERARGHSQSEAPPKRATRAVSRVLKDRHEVALLSVVVPAYNEARRLPPSLERIVAYLEARGCVYEILV